MMFVDNSLLDIAKRLWCFDLYESYAGTLFVTLVKRTCITPTVKDIPQSLYANPNRFCINVLPCKHKATPTHGIPKRTISSYRFDTSVT